MKFAIESSPDSFESWDARSNSHPPKSAQSQGRLRSRQAEWLLRARGATSRLMPSPTPVLHLLYVGISPSAPPAKGKAASKQTLSHRVRSHMRGNASGSTLRLSLGCILADQLGIALRRVGRRGRFTFSAGEQRLSEWMEENARVVWQVYEEPWLLEEKLISTLHLPLNLDQNTRNEFFPVLSGLRKAAKARAKALPILQG